VGRVPSPYFAWAIPVPPPREKFLNCGEKNARFYAFLLQKKLLVARKLAGLIDPWGLKI